MSWDDAPLLGGRELLPLMSLPFGLPFPLKEEGEGLSGPVVLAGGHVLLVGVELEDSDTVIGWYTRASSLGGDFAFTKALTFWGLRQQGNHMGLRPIIGPRLGP